MNKEIEKLCSDIKPETLKAYAESKGWTPCGIRNDHKAYKLKEYAWTLMIPFRLGSGLTFPAVNHFTEAEDRPILAILFDLWKLQNPDANDLSWIGDHLKSNQLEPLYLFWAYTIEALGRCDIGAKSILRCATLSCERDEKDKRIADCHKIIEMKNNENKRLYRKHWRFKNTLRIFRDFSGKNKNRFAFILTRCREHRKRIEELERNLRMSKLNVLARNAMLEEQDRKITELKEEVKRLNGDTHRFEGEINGLCT